MLHHTAVDGGASISVYSTAAVWVTRALMRRWGASPRGAAQAEGRVDHAAANSPRRPPGVARVDKREAGVPGTRCCARPIATHGAAGAALFRGGLRRARLGGC